MVLRAPHPRGLKGRKLIGFDVETHLIRQGRKCPRLVCLSLAGEGKPPPYITSAAKTFGADFVIAHENGVWTALMGRKPAVEVAKKLLADPSITLIAHNAVYDCAVLANEDVSGEILQAVFNSLEDGDGCDIRCTKVRELLIANAMGRAKFDPRTQLKTKYSLAYCMLAYFKKDLSNVKTDPDAWRLRYHELDGVPVTRWPPEAASYAVMDSLYTLELAKKQGEFTQADNGEVVVTFDGAVVDETYQLRADWALHLMACWGPRTNAESVEEWNKELRAYVDQVDRQAEAAGFVEKGKKKMSVLRRRISAAYEGNPPLTATGNVKFDKDTLMGSGDAALKSYAEGGEARKNLTTYLPILRLGVKHPLTSSPNVFVRSGRTSWTKPSLQTGPRKGDYRKSFEARPGKCFVAADYDRIELASLAQVHYWMFGESSLRDAFLAGEDLHLSLAADMLGISYKEAETRLKQKDPEIKRMRQGAKIANFGFPGGLVARTFVDYAAGFDFHISLTEAERIRRAWLDRWPEMTPYFNDVSDKAKWGKFTFSQWVSGRQRSECTYTVAANTAFQGLTADGAKRALYAVAKECYTDESSHLFGVRPWVFVHDEIIAEGPIDTVDLWAKRLSRVMEQQMASVIPDVPIGVEAAAMFRWDKDATPTYNESGELVPWSG